MNQKETGQIEPLTEEQKKKYAKTIENARHNIPKIEARGLIQVRHELIYDSRLEVIRTDVDESFLRAVKGVAYGASRELFIIEKEEFIRHWERIWERITDGQGDSGEIQN